jgi:hypothetical protein
LFFPENVGVRVVSNMQQPFAGANWYEEGDKTGFLVRIVFPVKRKRRRILRCLKLQFSFKINGFCNSIETRR